MNPNKRIHLYPFLLLVLMVGFSSNLLAQALDVKGIVKDETDFPLPGVTIQVIGSPRGVTTDIDGTYTIKVDKGAKLKFSYIGMQDYTTVVNGPIIDVVLKDAAKLLQDVTVVAFAKQKKESVLASITTVKPAELKVPSSNLTTALAGRVSGLISYQRSGEPGQDDANFFVRGVTSFSYASSPLILIDGVEMTSSDLSRLQSDDIASFSIMKDATATALYGARGANGVILVTTKEGTEGKAKVSVRYECSFSEPTKNIELADPITYMRLNNEAVSTRDPLAEVPYSLEKIERTQEGLNPMIFPATDWRSLLMKNQTVNHRLNFNLSGGTKTARYYIAGTYTQDNGILKVDKRNNFNSNIDLKKYLLRSNITIDVTPTTQVVTRLHATFDDYSGPMDGGSDLYKKILRSDPVLFPAYYEPDEINRYKKHILFGNYDAGNYVNPYADLVKGYKEYDKTLVMAQFEVKQDLNFLLKGLNVRAMFSTQRSSYSDVTRSYSPYYYALDKYDAIAGTYTLNNISVGKEYLGYSEGDKQITSTTYGEAALSYDNKFAELHGVSGLLVFQARNQNVSNAGTLTSSLPHRNLGLSGRFTYNYDTRYFLEFNFGYNGSERFAKQERYGFFPSAGLGYIISNESFWPTNITPYLNSLKLKATYGLVGNDAIGDSKKRFFYLSEINMSGSGYVFGDEYGNSYSGVSILQYPNPNITWERSYKMNLGIETKLLNCMDLAADYYTERRTGILMTRSYIPANMGLAVIPQANVGEAKSHGFDASLDLNHSFNKDLWLTGRFNFTYATSEFVKYEDVDQSATPWLNKVGQAVGQTWGYVAERLFVDEADVANSPVQFGNYGAGDIKYRDINDDGKITSEDRVPIGYPTQPEIVYGFGFSGGYKDFDLSCFFQGLARESFWIDAKKTAPFIDTDDEAAIISKNALLKAYADNHWSESNRNEYALWPRLSAELNTNNTQTSTWWMRDGSFLRLKSVELGYTLPQNISKKAAISNCRIYASGTNLLTFSVFKMWDPEMAGDGMKYPTQRVFNLGVQVSF